MDANQAIVEIVKSVKPEQRVGIARLALIVMALPRFGAMVASIVAILSLKR